MKIMKKLLFCMSLLFMLGSCNSFLENRLVEQMVDAPETQAEKDKNLILQYAIDNKLNLESTASGIYFIIDKKGEGDRRPNKNSNITAHYTGSLLDGTVFDSSHDRGEPLKFKLAQVIKGWQQSIPMLKKNGKGTFIIPSELAYGERGAGELIPPNSVLVFDIELLNFVNK